ncbi:MAG: class I adenylate-forming enzyme family protein, partial [Pseudomonadota bacterium]
MNLAADVLATAAANPDKVALVVMGRTGAERWSFGRLAEAVHGMAGALADRAPPGARVLLRLGNGPRFPVAFLGAAAAGLVPVPSATALTGPEITALARRVNPALILADPAVALPDHPAAVLRDLDAMMAAPPMAPVLGDPERPGYIVFTSGSGGVPRAVVHAHRAIRARRAMWDGWYGLTPNDRVCHAGAFNWTFTLGTGLMDPWAAGATALVPGPDVPVSALPLLLKRFEATIFAAVPGVFRKLLASDLPHLPRLRHGLTAGERLPAALRTDWRAATGADIHEALGMSECSTFISGSPDRPAPEGRAGYVQPGRRVAVLDEAGGVVAPGSIGRLAVHRSEPGLMLGYLQEDGSARLPL